MKKLAIGSILFLALTVSAQTTDKYAPTDAELWHLKYLQSQARLAQQESIAAQQTFQEKLAEFTAEAEKIKKSHGWADSVSFDPNNVLFCQKEVVNPRTGSLQCPTVEVPPPPAPKKEEKKKP